MTEALEKVRSISALFVQAARALMKDDGMSWAAALAFYMSLSLAPLLILTVYVGGLLDASTQDALARGVERAAGTVGADVIRKVLHSAERQRGTGLVSMLAGSATLLLAATAVFSHLQNALNHVWGVEPIKGARAIWAVVRKRLVSLLMIPLVLVLLIAWQIAAGVVGLVLAKDATGWLLLERGLSLVLHTVLFALVYRIFPNVKVAWSDAWVGASITAGLFVLGRHLTGLYLARSSLGSAYGAAGSLVVLLIWVYYCSIILLYGAEITRVYSQRYGRGQDPAEPA